MDKPSARLIDAGFERVRALRRIERNRALYQDPDYWRALNPQLTISPSPFTDVPPIEITAEEVEMHARQLRDEGYLQTRPLAPADVCARLASGIVKLAESGVHTAFAALYDEYYQVFQGLEPLFAPILGDGYRWLGDGVFAFHVPAGDTGAAGLSALGPHRDSLGPDPAVLNGQVPTIVNLWVPLNDVSPAESCIYVVPADLDPDYFTPARTVDRAGLNLQAIRAVPVEARAVLAWSTHLVHWGSAASRRARHPRMSAAIYFQRRDLPPYDPDSIFDAAGDVPFRRRLRWVWRSIGCLTSFEEPGAP